MRQISESLNANISRPNTGCVVIPGEFGGGNSIRRHAERINDVGADQIGVAESKCLSQACVSSVQSIQYVFVGVEGRWTIDTID